MNKHTMPFHPVKQILIAALVAAATALAAGAASVPAVTIKNGGRISTGDFVAGYRFALETPITVTDLGVTDQNKDGKLNDTEPVKMAIWDAAGKEIVAAAVPVNATAENGAFYVAITPLRLEAGSYVIGALFHTGGERFFYDSQIEVVPGIRWEEGRVARGKTLMFPRQPRSPASSYFGPVFKVLAGAATTALVSSQTVATASEPSATATSPLCVTQPLERAVFQRDGHGRGEVPVAGTIAGGQAGAMEVRAVDRQTRQVAKDWTAVALDPGAGAFRTRLSLPAGWYQIEWRFKRNGAVIVTGTVERVGVGEVFVTCGQSNSANHGQPPQKASEDRVSTCDFQTGRWTHGDDPQPGATGGGGSPWALLGDRLVKTYGVPVGFICVGVGSTRVSHWLPPASRYLRIRQALQLAGPHGVRAVLWHQGETDSMVGTSSEEYAKLLGQTIAQSRKDAGWDVPWGVALASYHPSDLATPERQLAVVAGQKKVIAEVPGVFQGPETDSFHTRGFLAGNVHFNAQGLAAHAQGWADALAPLLRQEVRSSVRETTPGP